MTIRSRDRRRGPDPHPAPTAEHRPSLLLPPESFRCNFLPSSSRPSTLGLWRTQGPRKRILPTSLPSRRPVQSVPALAGIPAGCLAKPAGGGLLVLSSDVDEGR